MGLSDDYCLRIFGRIKFCRRVEWVLILLVLETVSLLIRTVFVCVHVCQVETLSSMLLLTSLFQSLRVEVHVHIS